MYAVFIFPRAVREPVRNNWGGLCHKNFWRQ
jgi:hypothetical protein